jgi:hypothetical protein
MTAMYHQILEVLLELSIHTVRFDVLIAGENSTLLGYWAASCGMKLPLHVA